MFNELVLDVLKTSGLMKSGDLGFIDPVKANADDWSHYDWQKELGILGSFDTNASSQSDDFIGDAQESEIIRNYFNIAGEINARINIKFYIFGLEYNLIDLVVEAAGKDAYGNNNYDPEDDAHTNAYLCSLDWAEELADISTLTNAITDYSNNPNPFTALVDFAADLVTIRTHETLAGKAANSILVSVEPYL